MHLSLVLFLMSAFLVTKVRYTGWSFFIGHVVLLFGAVVFAWQLGHQFVGITGEFLELLLNCWYATIVGMGLGAKYLKDT